MEDDSRIYVGLDVHKDTIAIGAAEAGRQPARVIGTQAHDVKRLLKAFGQAGAARAGACGLRGGADRLRAAAGAGG